MQEQRHTQLKNFFFFFYRVDIETLVYIDWYILKHCFFFIETLVYSLMQ